VFAIFRVWARFFSEKVCFVEEIPFIFASLLTLVYNNHPPDDAACIGALAMKIGIASAG
jgi:hypothetical protein